jgi:hypothetical protein
MSRRMDVIGEQSTHDTDETRLLRHILAAPREVARLEAERAVLEASATNANGVDALGAELGARGLAAELELSLLAVVGALGAGRGALVPGVASDTCRALPRLMRHDREPIERHDAHPS